MPSLCLLLDAFSVYCINPLCVTHEFFALFIGCCCGIYFFCVDLVFPFCWGGSIWECAWFMLSSMSLPSRSYGMSILRPLMFDC